MSVLLNSTIEPVQGFDFTVLMAVYWKDDPGLFMSALSSIFQNSMLPRQVVVVADGEITQELTEIIEELREGNNNLSLIKLPKNIGLAGALNVGLSAVSSEWVARADADDINYPDRFEKTFTAIARAEHLLDIVGTAIEEVDERGSKIAVRSLPAGDEKIKTFLMRRNPFNHMTTVFRTAAAKRAGGYPELYLKEEYGLWAKMISQGCRCKNLPDITVTAMTGSDFYARRGGFRYAQAEYGLQRHLYTCRIKPLWMAILDFLLRGAVFILPEQVRRHIYIRVLRKPFNG